MGKNKNRGITYLIIIAFAMLAWVGKNKLSCNAVLPQESIEEESSQPKGKISDEIIDGDPTLLECPRLSGGNNNYFISHWANGMVNFSMEYDVVKHCPRWVAFTFDDVNSEKNHSGRGKWQWDSKVPAIYDISDLYRNSGYDRGHMVASNDRQYSQEANQGTFVMTNVCPQTHSFNAGMWKRLEQKVQNWGRNPQKRDIIYIAKGTVLNDNMIEKNRLGDKIAIPKYFWMALIAKKDGKYNGIAFLLEQREYQKGETIKDFALSIDDLEKFIGIDLFHNFDDQIENTVEVQNPDSKDSRRYWWN